MKVGDSAPKAPEARKRGEGEGASSKPQGDHLRSPFSVKDGVTLSQEKGTGDPTFTATWASRFAENYGDGGGGSVSPTAPANGLPTGINPSDLTNLPGNLGKYISNLTLGKVGSAIGSVDWKQVGPAMQAGQWGDVAGLLAPGMAQLSPSGSTQPPAAPPGSAAPPGPVVPPGPGGTPTGPPAPAVPPGPSGPPAGVRRETWDNLTPEQQATIQGVNARGLPPRALDAMTRGSMDSKILGLEQDPKRKKEILAGNLGSDEFFAKGLGFGKEIDWWKGLSQDEREALWVAMASDARARQSP